MIATPVPMGAALAIFSGQFFAGLLTARRLDRGLLGHRLIPCALPMQFDHRGLTGLADVGAQAGTLPDVAKAGHNSRLAAHDAKVAQNNRAHDQQGWHTKEPGKALAPCDGFGVGRPHRHGGRLFRVQQRIDKGVKRIKQRQHDPRQQRGLEQRTHRHNRGLAKVGQRIGTAYGGGTRFLGGGV